ILRSPCTRKRRSSHRRIGINGSPTPASEGEPQSVVLHAGEPVLPAIPTLHPTYMRKHALALTVLLAIPVGAHAQKKVLTQSDWDKWKSINAPALTPDGKWAVYTLVPQVGDGEMVVRSTSGSTEYRVPRGFLGRPNNTP